MVEATASRGAVMGLDEVLVVPDVVTPAEQEVLRDWALIQCAAGTLHQNPVDPTSRSTPFFAAADRSRSELTRRIGEVDVASEVIWVPEASGPEFLPDEFWSVRSRVVELLGLDLPDDPYKGSFLTCVAPGGDVHAHIDARLTIGAEPMPLLRCNVLVQRPDEGGMPVIGGQLIDVPERGMWALHPTELLHGATAVVGERERITLSFGFVVDPEPVWQRQLRHSPDLEPPVLAGLRSTLRAGAVEEDRMLILDSLLSRPQSTVSAVAADIGQPPGAVWQEAHQLLRLGVLRSDAPERVATARRYTI